VQGVHVESLYFIVVYTFMLLFSYRHCLWFGKWS